MSWRIARQARRSSGQALGLFAELGVDLRGKLYADGRHARGLGDERFGRFVCLPKRGCGEAKRHDDACRDAGAVEKSVDWLDGIAIFDGARLDDNG
ncbi:MAG: hypothetical protein CM1200mP29_11760 [Verrucomicrobiota bacterium]|nr:MAG: hypothetical protein CM1200mP29_11760 [Verrucomicrobiota bacterium]